MSSRVSRAAHTFSFLCSLFLLLSATLAGAEVGLDVELGFRGVFELGRPFPLDIPTLLSGGDAKRSEKMRESPSQRDRGGRPTSRER